MTNRAQLISALERYATKKNTVTESSVLSALMKNITWVKGDKGDRGPVGPIGPVGPRGPQGEKGDKGNDAPPIPVKLLVEEMAKDGRFKGEHGEDGTANMDEVMECAEECAEHEMEEHEKEYDHKLLHDSKMLGEYELDQTTLKDGDILQVKGKKLVGVKILDFNNMLNAYGARLLRGISSTTRARYRIKTITTSYTLDPLDDVLHIDASSGNLTVTIYSSNGEEGGHHFIKRIDSTLGNTVTFQMTGGETIDFETLYQLVNQGSGAEIYNNGSNWFIKHT